MPLGPSPRVLLAVVALTACRHPPPVAMTPATPAPDARSVAPDAPVAAVLDAALPEAPNALGLAIFVYGAVIGEQSILGAGALVTGGTEIPPGSLVLGSPAKVVRALTADEQAALPGWAEKYIKVAAHHRRFD